MDNLKSIHDFVDGTLETEEEEQLFMQLAGSEELRSELKQNLAIRDAVRSDSRAYTPAPQSTINIYKNLGFNKPPGLTEKEPDSMHDKPGLFSKYKQGVAGASIMAAAALIAFLILFRQQLFSPSSTSTGIADKSLNTGISQAPEYPVMKSQPAEKTENIESRTKEKIIYKPVYIYVPVQNTNEDNLSSNSGINIQAEEASVSEGKLPVISFSEIPNAQIILFDRQSNHYFRGIAKHLPLSLAGDFIPENKIGLSAEISGEQYWFSQNPTIAPEQYAKFNNTSLAMLYSFGEHFSAGLDVRQENFFQSYKHVDSLGNTYIYEQQPNFTSSGFIARYKIGRLFGVINPFSQIYAGATNAGSILRLMTGFEIGPFGSISFILGGEYSRLFYFHNKQNYQTSKFGINYGVSLNF